jgi:hypothetical protein
MVGEIRQQLFFNTESTEVRRNGFFCLRITELVRSDLRAIV